MINPHLARLRCVLRFVRGFGACVLVAVVAVFSVAPSASAAFLASLAIKLKIVTVAGSATNQVTNVVFHDNGTISLEAVQVGYLSHFGNFTGHFSYSAVPSPGAILLLGSGTLINQDGERLTLTASVLELGADYPYTIIGTLTVTGGTGRFARATGELTISGTDTGSLTDTLDIQGALVMGL